MYGFEWRGAVNEHDTESKTTRLKQALQSTTPATGKAGRTVTSRHRA